MRRGTRGHDAMMVVTDEEVLLDAEGHVMKGTTVRGKTALAVLLGQWLGASTATTIGDVGTLRREPLRAYPTR